MSLHNFLIQFAFLYAPLMHPPTEQITPYLYRGPDPKVKDIYALHAKGVKTIVSLRTNPEWKKEKLCQKLGMHWYNIKTGVFETPTAGQIDTFRTIVNNPQNRPVYTSCEIGMDRTAVYLAAWRRVDDGWTSEQVTEDFRAHHRKTWWPIFRKYERVVNQYADTHRSAVAQSAGKSKQTAVTLPSDASGADNGSANKEQSQGNQQHS